MIELTDQSVLYLGILMYSIFMIATAIEFRKMIKRSSSKAVKKNKFESKKEVPIRNIKVANYR